MAEGVFNLDVMSNEVHNKLEGTICFQVTATNQETLEQKEEPLRTLKRFRQGKHLGLTNAAVYYG